MKRMKKNSLNLPSRCKSDKHQLPLKKNRKCIFSQYASFVAQFIVQRQMLRKKPVTMTTKRKVMLTSEVKQYSRKHVYPNLVVKIKY